MKVRLEQKVQDKETGFIGIVKNRCETMDKRISVLVEDICGRKDPCDNYGRIVGNWIYEDNLTTNIKEK